MLFINRLTFIALKIIIFIYEKEEPMSMRIRKLLQRMITRPVLYTVSISRIQLITMSLAVSKPKHFMKTQPCEN